MKGLLKLTEDKSDVARLLELCTRRGIVIQHKREGCYLTPEMVERGTTVRYGQTVVGPGSTFGNRWKLVDTEGRVMKASALEGLKICFKGKEWVRPLKDQQQQVKRLGGVSVDSVDAEVDVVVCASDGEGEIASPDETLPATLVISEAVFQRILPKTPKKGAKAKSKSLAANSRNIWKLLKQRDVLSIEQGLSLAVALEEPQTIDDLLDGVSVNPESGRLELNKRFSGSGPAQPFLNLALLGLLSAAGEGSKGAEVRAQVRHLVLVDGGLGGMSGGSPALPRLVGFHGLEHLTIQFVNGLVVPDLQAFGALPSLVELSLEPVFTTPNWGPVKRGTGRLQSLDGLDASALEVVSLAGSGVQHLDPLGPATRLRVLRVNASSELERIDALGGGAHLEELRIEACPKLKSLGGLESTTKLMELNLCGCAALKSLKPLQGNQGLVKVDLDDCVSLESLVGLSATGSVRFGMGQYASGGGIMGVPSLTSLAGLSALCSSVTSVIIDDARALQNLETLEACPGVTALKITGAGRFSSLEGLERLPALERLVIQGACLTSLDSLPLLETLKELVFLDCAALTDVSRLGEFTALTTVLVDGAPNLVAGPATWKARGLKNLGFNGASRLLELGDLDMVESLEGVDVRECGITSLGALSGQVGMISGTINHLGGFTQATMPNDSYWSGPWLSPKLKQLKGLDLSNCRGLEDLAGLGDGRRPGVQALRLTGCRSLTSLEGVQGCTDLKFLELGDTPSLRDASALKGTSDLVASISVGDSVAFPRNIAKALAGVPGLRLQIVESESLTDLAAIGEVTGLAALDLEGCPAVRDLSPLIPLAGLSALRAPAEALPRGFAAFREGNGDAGLIHKLQRALCKKGDVGLPAHLSAEKTKKPMGKDVKSAFRSLKKLLISTDPQQVQQGVELMVSFGIPEIWDQLTEGFEPLTGLQTGYGSDSLPGMGRVFGKGRVKDQLYARWALLQVLSTAPPAAEEACARRASVETIDIQNREYGDPPPLPLGQLSLAGFSSLKKLAIGPPIDGAELSWLAGANALEELRLTTPEVTDLSGLGTLGALRELTLDAATLGSAVGAGQATGLECVVLDAPALTTVEGLGSPEMTRFTVIGAALESLAGLRTCEKLSFLKLESCQALTSLDGIERCAALTDLWVRDCPALVNVSALRSLSGVGSVERKTNTYYGNKDAGVLNLVGAGDLEDLAWLEGFSGSELHTLKLTCRSSVDLSVLASVQSLKTLSLALRGEAGDLVGLDSVEDLTVNMEAPPSRVGEAPKLKQLGITGVGDFTDWPKLPSLLRMTVNASVPVEIGDLEAPRLQKLVVTGGESLMALPSLPELQTLSVKVTGDVGLADLGDQRLVGCALNSGRLKDCAGLAGVGKLSVSSSCVIESLDGLGENQRLQLLHLGPFYEGLTTLAPLAQASNLRVLNFGIRDGAEDAETLLNGSPAMPQVTSLALGGYSGDLSFLKGWRSLAVLKLCDSGVLTGLETLKGLPKLEVVHLRGTDTKRDMWPEALHDRLDFQGSYDTYDARFKES